MYLPVKTSGTQQGGIEHVGTVGSGEDDHTAVRPETVHLREELVERTLAFVVTTGHNPLTAGTADSIYLIDEDDSRCFLFGLTEEVTHTTCTHTDKHLHKVRTAHGEEGHTGLTGYSFGKQGLTGTRRTYQQGTFGNFRTDLGVFLGVLEELDDLLHFLLGAVQTGYIFEGHFVLFLAVEELCLGFAHTEDTTDTTGTTDATAHVDKEEQNQRKRQDVHQDDVPVVVGLGVGHIDRCLTGLFTRVVDAVHVFGELLDRGHLSA